MALRTQVISVLTTLASVKDYTGSPITTVIGTIVDGSLSLPLVRARERNVVFINSTTGRSIYANPDHGLTDPNFVEFDVWITDPKNQTDIGPTDLFRALANNIVTATSVSTHIYTSQLTGGGALMCVLIVSMIDTGGTTHTCTVNVEINEFTSAVANSTMQGHVKAKVLGAMVWT